LKTRGVTLLELVVGFSLFSLIGLLLVFAFTQAGNVYRAVSGSTDSRIVLGKSQAVLQRDLERTKFSTVGVGPGLNSLGPLDSDVIWFLSAVNPATERLERKVDGSPFWQCNILYYAAVPANHATHVGFNCTGGADAEGYEVQCPHKVLVRMVIDKGTPTDPANESTEETLLTPGEAAAYLGRPDGFNTATLSGAGLLQTSLPATNLLTFRAELNPDSVSQREIRMRVGAVATLSAQRQLAIGQTRLDQTEHYSNVRFSVFSKLP
jgi:hypothetical protein